MNIFVGHLQKVLVLVHSLSRKSRDTFIDVFVYRLSNQAARLTIKYGTSQIES